MRACFLAAIFWSLCVCRSWGQGDQKMNFGQLRTDCVAEIERGSYTSLKGIKVVDFKLLAWYRIRDRRPWYVDNALCWCKTTTVNGSRWVLVHMARNPDPTGSKWRNADLNWHSYHVTDVPVSWFLYFEHPPKNDDIYNRMPFFRFETDKNWEMYDSQILSENWAAAMGDRPTKKFSNKAASVDTPITHHAPSATGH